MTVAARPNYSTNVELSIHEFDQWSNGKTDLAIRPTTICWFAPEAESGPRD